MAEDRLLWSGWREREERVRGERGCWVVSGRTLRSHCKMRGVEGTLTPNQDREDKTHPHTPANWSIEVPSPMSPKMNF